VVKRTAFIPGRRRWASACPVKRASRRIIKREFLFMAFI
jgi:hypothetical protein